jgi:hypothetical protein
LLGSDDLDAGRHGVRSSFCHRGLLLRH